MLDPVDIRIAGRICLLMSVQEAATGIAERPVLDISHSGLADMTGLTRQTVSSVLQRWRKADLVDLGYRQLVVLDPAALRRIRDGSPIRSVGSGSG